MKQINNMTFYALAFGVAITALAKGDPVAALVGVVGSLGFGFILLKLIKKS